LGVLLDAIIVAETIQFYIFCFISKVNKFRFLLVLCAVSSISLLSAQSLRINEVSQGPSGSKEYVELVVTGPVLTSCSDQPQCLDLRGWILDDNNGYFSNGVLSGTGLAAGAVRFANDPLWQCINPGTIILIYNDNDPNSSVPPQDISNTDGNCKLVIPISSTKFERHETAPNNTSMAYATNGWVAGGNWTVISMANGDDSFQVYAPSNTTVPVHGVSWGNNNSNNFIYFSGAAGGLVYSCLNGTSGDFSLQSNWTSAPVASGQTPGVANSTQNAALLGGMNLNCGTPLVVTVTPVNESCAGNCDGSATLTVSGGQAPYQTPIWSNGTVAAQVSGLCPNNYSVEVTDANGCSSTQNFTISSNAGFTITTSGNTAVCQGQSVLISASGATSYNWDNGLGAGNSFNVTPNVTTTYTVTGSAGGCTASASLTVTVNPLPSVDAGPDQAICTGGTVTLSGSGANTYAWDQNVVNGQPFVPVAGNHIYTVTGTTAAGCSATDQVNVTVGDNLTVNAGPDLIVCTGESIILTATGANQYIWSDNVINGEAFVPAFGVSTYTVTGISGNCSGQDEVMIIVNDCGWALEMPNVFTPNGDLQNDLFIPVRQENITVKQFEIFNRWGNVVYGSDAQLIAWNGKTQSGEEASNGVYFYKLTFTDSTQAENTVQGFLHLIRN